MHASNPYAPPQAHVHDVLVSAGPFEHADLATRFAAAIIDGLILGGIIYAPFIAAVVADSGSSEISDTALGIALLAMFAGLSVWCWFTVKYVVRNGQTIGKKLRDIRVVRSDGSKASLARIFWLRNVVNGLLGIIPIYGLVDHLFIFGSARQCLHDKIADTIVVKA